jgi:2-keto-4-pentenoate hydratase
MAAREIDPRVVAGLRRQHKGWRALLGNGAERVGWKIGINDPRVQERLEITEPVIGFLTSASTVADGGSHPVEGMEKPFLEPEVAIELRRDVEGGAAVDEALAAIESLGPAIELVDVPQIPDDLEAVLAGNVFHRAVVFGPTRQDVALSGLTVGMRVNGEERAGGPAAVDLAETIRLVADLLGSCGERLLAGDRIIAGSLTAPLPVTPGDAVELELGELGLVGLSIDA